MAIENRSSVASPIPRPLPLSPSLFFSCHSVHDHLASIRSPPGSPGMHSRGVCLIDMSTKAPFRTMDNLAPSLQCRRPVCRLEPCGRWRRAAPVGIAPQWTVSTEQWIMTPSSPRRSRCRCLGRPGKRGFCAPLSQPSGVSTLQPERRLRGYRDAANKRIFKNHRRGDLKDMPTAPKKAA